jgi:hypothetical protein
MARRAGAPQTAIEERMRHYRKVIKSLREFVDRERRLRSRLSAATSEVAETTLEPMMIAGSSSRATPPTTSRTSRSPSPG